MDVELMTRQCAWCWLVMDPSGHYDLRPGRKIKSATHGICPSCKELVRAEIDGSAAFEPLPQPLLQPQLLSQPLLVAA